MLSSTIPKETRVKQLREEALKWTQCKCIWTGQQRNKQYNRGHCVFTWKPVTQNKEIPVSLTLTWTSRADCWQRLNWMYWTCGKCSSTTFYMSLLSTVSSCPRLFKKSKQHGSVFFFGVLSQNILLLWCGTNWVWRNLWQCKTGILFTETFNQTLVWCKCSYRVTNVK